MANDWRDLDYKKIGRAAAEKTDDKLASKISSLTKLTDADVKRLFPEKGDVANFIELMTIVKSADAKNTKIRQIMSNSEKFGTVVLTLLSKVIS